MTCRKIEIRRTISDDTILNLVQTKEKNMVRLVQEEIIIYWNFSKTFVSLFSCCCWLLLQVLESKTKESHVPDEHFPRNCTLILNLRRYAGSSLDMDTTTTAAVHTELLPLPTTIQSLALPRRCDLMQCKKYLHQKFPVKLLCYNANAFQTQITTKTKYKIDKENDWKQFVLNSPLSFRLYRCGGVRLHDKYLTL